MWWRSIAFDKARYLPKKKACDAENEKRQPGALQHFSQFLRRNSAKAQGYKKQGFQQQRTPEKNNPSTKELSPIGAGHIRTLINFGKTAKEEVTRHPNDNATHENRENRPIRHLELDSRIHLLDGEKKPRHQSKAHRGGELHYPDKIAFVLLCRHQASMIQKTGFVKFPGLFVP